MKTIFLSSTFKDLAEYRKAAIEAIESLDGYHCIRLENFGARDWESEEFCRAKVAECDLFIGILGHSHGGCPEGSADSYTECEYDTAVAENKPRLMFVAPEDFQLRADLIEDDSKRKRQQVFRERVNGERIRDTFSSPDDLAKRITQAVYNWEREQTASQQPTTRQWSRTGIILPPEPYFAHPYPLQPNFTGRVNERRMLTEWLEKGLEPVFVLTAIGGMGKSALTWAWVQRDVLGLPLLGAADEPIQIADACRIPSEFRPEGVLWWSFYNREAGFSTFLDRTLFYVSAGNTDPTDTPSTHEKMIALVDFLQQHQYLLVLDGLERILRAYSSLDAAYRGDTYDEDERGDFRSCTDRYASEFLQRIASLPLQSRILVTSRLLPRELDDLAGRRHEHLKSMDSEDACEFLHAQGIRGTRAEIEEICAPYGYHPLAIRLLAGVIANDKRHPGDIQVAHRHPVLPELRGKEQHHILQVAYDSLGKQQRALLSRIAAFRGPVAYDALSVFSIYKRQERFDDELEELIGRGLLLFHRERAVYDLHPIVRQYAYRYLSDKRGAHLLLREFFASRPMPSERRIHNASDLSPIIELYHHTVRAGRHEQAAHLFSDRLGRQLFRLGAFSVSIQLLRALFPDGEDRPPELAHIREQSWVACALAGAYSVSGHPRRAAQLYAICARLDESQRDKINLGIDLGSLAARCMELGELTTAEHSLRRRIELCREIQNELRGAVAREELGRLMAYMGLFEESHSALSSALSSYERLGNAQDQCVVWSYMGLRGLLIGDAAAALAAARRERELASEVARTMGAHERDAIWVEWLLGSALVASVSECAREHNGLLMEAHVHLNEALTRCRRASMVELEPDILLAWAQWYRARHNPVEATDHAREALSIADRCEYRLKQADIHNFLARLDIETGDRDSAIKHAQTGYERAWCDGPPHCYKPALDEAERLLNELGAPKPKMPDV